MQAPSLLSPRALSSALKGSGRSAIKILDCSWYMPFMNRNPKDEFAQQSESRTIVVVCCAIRAYVCECLICVGIPGARFFDIDVHCDKGNDLPHMLPSASEFEKAACELNIGCEDHVVVYDCSGFFFSAPRVWYTFKTFGHSKVSVLDGGFKEWVRLGFDVEKGMPPSFLKEPRVETAYRANFCKEFVKDMDFMERGIENGSIQIVDARSSGRFKGIEPEPRPGTPSGHMKGAANVTFNEIVQPGSFVLKSKEDLKKVFDSAKVDFSKPIVASCGSGVTACCLLFALDNIGVKGALYDVSL